MNTNAKLALSVREAAELLSLSPWTIRKMLRDGRLQPTRIGRLVRVEPDSLETLLAQGRPGARKGYENAKRH